jgi:phenylacetate-CoA ligase
VYAPVLGVLTRRVIEPVIDARYLTTARWLQEFDRWSEAQRQAWQQDRLAEMLAHAQRQVPFYRQLLAGRSQVELLDLPVVDKARMRPAMDAFLSEGWEQMPHINKRTGGTTGDPWRYPLGKNGWTQIYAAALRFREDLGYRYGDRMVLVGTPRSLAPGGTGWKTSLRYRLERRVTTTAGLEVDHATSLRRARLASEAGATLWYGYAGTLAAMAAAVLHEGIQVRPPKAILTSSEILLPEWREQIERAFGVRVADEYGCNDGGVLAQTCTTGRFHLADNLSLVEILDEQERACAPGVEGEIVVTNLHTRVLPFLRYKVGDRGADPPLVLPGPLRRQRGHHTVADGDDRADGRRQAPGGGPHLRTPAHGDIRLVTR